MPFNTIFQLNAMLKSKSPMLDIADKFLLTPDLLNYYLTGSRRASSPWPPRLSSIMLQKASGMSP